MGNPQDQLEAIRQREAEHQQLHEDASIPGCLPGGCAPDEGDVPVLIRMVDALRAELLEARRPAIRPSGLGESILCAAPGTAAVMPDSAVFVAPDSILNIESCDPDAYEGTHAIDCPGDCEPPHVPSGSTPSTEPIHVAKETINVAPKRNAGRPRNCPNYKTCKGRLKGTVDKAIGICRKCRKAAKTTSLPS